MDATLQVIFNILVMLVGGLFGFILNRIFKKMDDLQQVDTDTSKELSTLSIKLPTEYVHKGEFNHMVDALFKKLDRIELKIDQKADKE